MKFSEMIAVGFLSFVIAVFAFVIIGTGVGTSKVDAFRISLPPLLATVKGWESIKDEPDLQVAKFWGVYYVGARDDQFYPHVGRRCWMARTWQMDDELRPILDAQLPNNP